MGKRNTVCPECGAFESLDYDVVTGGYVCEKCGALYDAEGVELGDYAYEEEEK